MPDFAYACDSIEVIVKGQNAGEMEEKALSAAFDFFGNATTLRVHKWFATPYSYTSDDEVTGWEATITVTREVPNV